MSAHLRASHLLRQALPYRRRVSGAAALTRFYGSDFNLGALPRAEQLETVDKETIYSSLKAATRRTKTKGSYHKIEHGSRLLALISPEKVRKACPHCDDLFKRLDALVPKR